MSSPALRLSLVALVLMASVAQGAILTRAIEAQKTLVEREEQMLDQAKQRVQQKAQDAYEVSLDAVSSVGDQLRYVVMYPLRMANEALERPRKYARYLLSKMPPLLGTEATTPSPTAATLPDDVEVVEEPSSEPTRLPQLVSNLQSLFTGQPTEENEQEKPNPYFEVVEVKYDGPKVLRTAAEQPSN